MIYYYHSIPDLSLFHQFSSFIIIHHFISITALLETLILDLRISSNWQTMISFFSVTPLRRWSCQYSWTNMNFFSDYIHAFRTISLMKYEYQTNARKRCINLIPIDSIPIWGKAAKIFQISIFKEPFKKNLQIERRCRCDSECNSFIVYTGTEFQ